MPLPQLMVYDFPTYDSQPIRKTESDLTGQMRHKKGGSA